MPIPKNYKKKEKIDMMHYSLEDFKTNLALQEGNELMLVEIFHYGVYRGFFSCDEQGIDSLVKSLSKHNLLSKKLTIYQSLQHIDEEDFLLSDSYNELVKKSDPEFIEVSDNDFTLYRYIFIDCDPIHKANTQVKDEELAFAIEVRDEIIKFLDEQGFNKPFIAFTGNGQHLYYRIDVPTTAENKNILKKFLETLNSMFSTDKVKIDTVVNNPARITKFYGSWSTKGDDSPDNPYRKCELTQIGDNSINDFALLEKIIEKYGNNIKSKKTESATTTNKKNTQKKSEQQSNNKEAPQNVHLPIEDVSSYLSKHNLDFTIEEKDDYILYKLSVCPFNEEHCRGESGLIQVKDRGVCFKCFHEHCKHHTMWDFIELFPCGTIKPITSNGKNEKTFNKFVLNGELLKNSKGLLFFYFRGETIPLQSEEFRNTVFRVYTEVNQEVPPTNIDTRIIGQLASYANLAKEAMISRRIVNDEHSLYYVLNDNEILSVDSSGCKITTHNPDNVFFLKKDLLPQVTPDFSSPSEDLPELLSAIFNVDDEQMPLLIASILSFFRQDINSPILVLKGSRGSCKSSCARIIINIINPSKVDLISFPDREDSLVASLSNSDLVAFDNVEKISESMSSKLCIAVTSGYTTKRKLFTDNTEIAICIRSNVIMTCIDNVVEKSDLAERSNIVHLERVSVYREEKEINDKVKTLMPAILGSIFNTLAKVFEIQDTIKLSKPPRMADFAFFAIAAMKAMGIDENDFLELYCHNVAEAISVCATDDPLITCIEKILNETATGVIDMSSEQLLERIKKTADKLNLTLHKYSSSSLSRALSSKEADLKALGIDFKREKNSIKRTIVLKKRPNGIETTASSMIQFEEVDLDTELSNI